MVELSIVIPNYNNEKYIKKCIDSILNQTFVKYEIIIVDDGSSDNSVEIIESMKKKNNKIKLIRQFNQNAAIARNKGIEIAKGKYILFIDSDDYINDNDSIKNMIDKIENNDLLLCNYKVVDENGNYKYDYKVGDDIITDGSNIIEKYAFISAVPTNKLFDMKIIRDHNIFFDNVDIGQDLNFYLKYLAFCNNVIITDDYSYCYRINNEGMTRKKNYRFLDIIKSVDCVRNFYKNNHIESIGVIDSVGLINYCAQMNRIEKYEQRRDRLFIYEYFNYFIKDLTIEKKYIETNKKLKRTLKVYRLRKNMKLIYLSNCYKSIKKVLLKIKK